MSARRRTLASLALIGISAFVAAGPLPASTFPNDFDWACTLSPQSGVTMGLYKTVDTSPYVFRDSGDRIDRVIRSGRAPWAEFIAEHPGVYVVVGVYLHGGATLVLDEGTRLILVYTDRETGESEECTSEDIIMRKVVTTLPPAMQLHDPKRGPLVLTDTSSEFDRSEQGGFKLYVRFTSLPGGSEYGYEVPDKVFLVKGGDEHADSH